MKYHADLLTPGFWQGRQQRIRNGELEDIFPYPPERRFGAQAIVAIGPIAIKKMGQGL